MLEALTDPRAQGEGRGVLFVAASQGGGKTEIVLNAVGFFADADPAPVLIVEPNVEMAEALSKDRLAPMISETPSLRAKVQDPKSRDSDNTIRHKAYPGGHLTLVGANSAAGLAMRPIRVFLGDELDRWPPSAGTEGDPWKLAETRTTAFWNAVKFAVTSPGVEGGRSWMLWQQSDQQEFFVACPDCGTEQFLKWSQVSWEKDADGVARPETAVYACEKCGVTWDDVKRWRAVREGAYKPTAEFRGWYGFRLPGMAVIGRKLSALVRQWLEAQGNPHLLQVFINTVLCEWWRETRKAVDHTGLLARREDVETREGVHVVPSRAALLVAGLDTQDDRLELSVYAYGDRFESWLLLHQKILGDPSGDAVWADVERWLLKPWPRESGGYDFIRATCVDTAGHHTQPAYDFCGPRFRRLLPDGGQAFVFATIGRAGAGDVWPRAASEKIKKVPLWTLHVDAAKESIYGRLAIAEPGPGYVHFPKTVGREFFEGLTAEHVVTRTDRKGYPRRSWEKRKAGARNEPLDCAVLAYAALCGLQAMGFDLSAEAAALGQRPVYEGEPEAREEAPAQPQAPRRQPSGWLGDTRNWLRR